MSEARRWQAQNQRHLVGSLDRLRAALGGEPATGELPPPMAVPYALDQLAARFGLSPFERELVLLAAGPELDGSFGRALGALQGDPALRRGTFGLALAKLPGAHWSALAPTGTLRRWELVHLDPGPVLTARPLAVDERVLHFLLGVSLLDPWLQPRLAEVESAPPVPPSRRPAVQALVDAWTGSGVRPVGVLVGRDLGGLEAVAAAAVAHFHGRPWRIRAADLPREPEERARFATRWGREVVLDRAVLLVDAMDADAESLASLPAVADALPGPMAVLCRDGVRLGRHEARRIEVGSVTVAEQRDAWASALPEAAARTLDRFAGTFDLELEAIAAVAAEAGADPARAWDRARARTRPRLEALAQPLHPTAGWDDLVLPEAQIAVLHAIAAQVRNRATVHERWGFGARSSRGLGIAALFAGVSGTGKTMAAEVLAAELGLDLFRIDLAAVVSKYIGETEKNLARIFDAAEAGGAILLFDEADALFGKRAEVKDSHDRYANIEVSYLLQRMESYRGLAILTSNLKQAMDQAFLRRLRFVVEFPFPDAGQRARIWQRAFPADTPVDRLDIDVLSRLNVTGGNIRNIALSAAFLAAEEGCPVGMAHVERAARAEYAKLGRSAAELRLRGAP